RRRIYTEGASVLGAVNVLAPRPRRSAEVQPYLLAQHGLSFGKLRFVTGIVRIKILDLLEIVEVRGPRLGESIYEVLGLFLRRNIIRLRQRRNLERLLFGREVLVYVF